MAEKIVLLGKKGFKRILLVWSGILAFILNLLGCEQVEPAYYAPPFFGDFKATGTVTDVNTNLPVKGIEVSVHMIDDEAYIDDSNEVGSDITDENGEFELDVTNVDVKNFIVYFHDIDPEADGNYSEKVTIITMPDDVEDTHTEILNTELSEVNE